MHVICYYIQVGCRFVSRKKGVRWPNLFTSISPKVQRKPWTRGEEKALVQFICLHDDRKSPSSTAVWPSMNPADPYWQEAAQYIHTTTGKSCLRTGKELRSCPLINSFFEFLVLNKDCLMWALEYFFYKRMCCLFEKLLSKLMFYYILLLSPLRDVDSNVCDCLGGFVTSVCEIIVCSLQS